VTQPRQVPEHPPRRFRLGRRSRERDARLSVEYFLRQRTSSFRRTLAASAVLSIVVIAGVSAALAVRQYQHAERTAAKDLEARAVVAAAVVDASFAGQISTLRSIAASPAVVTSRKVEMHNYFRRVERGSPPFNGGLGWIDKDGTLEVSSNPGAVEPVDLSQRVYVKKVLATGQPYVSAGLVGRRNGQQVIVTAVATHDRNGRVSGVLAGSTRVKAIGQNKASLELGFAGLSIVDRTGNSSSRNWLPSRTPSCCGESPTAAASSHVSTGSTAIPATSSRTGAPGCRGGRLQSTDRRATCTRPLGARSFSSSRRWRRQRSSSSSS
jgi:hypothetical protein